MALTPIARRNVTGTGGRGGQGGTKRDWQGQQNAGIHQTGRTHTRPPSNLQGVSQILAPATNAATSRMPAASFDGTMCEPWAKMGRHRPVRFGPLSDVQKAKVARRINAAANGLQNEPALVRTVRDVFDDLRGMQRGGGDGPTPVEQSQREPALPRALALSHPANQR